MRSSRGQELVEFAITLPLLIFLVMGIVDLGRGFYVYSVLYNSSREAARYGVIHPSPLENIQNKALQMAIGVIPPPVVTVTVTTVNPTTKTVNVAVSYYFTPVTPLMSALLPGGTVTLSTQSTMRVEQ